MGLPSPRSLLMIRVLPGCRVMYCRLPVFHAGHKQTGHRDTPAARPGFRGPLRRSVGGGEGPWGSCEEKAAPQKSPLLTPAPTPESPGQTKLSVKWVLTLP